MKTIGRILLILAVAAGISALFYFLATANGWTSLGRRTLEGATFLTDGNLETHVEGESGWGQGGRGQRRGQGGRSLLTDEAGGQEHGLDEALPGASLEWGRVLLQVALVTAVVAFLDFLVRRRRFARKRA